MVDAVVMTPLALAHTHLQGMMQHQQQAQLQQQQQSIMPKTTLPVVSMDVMEQKQWWHLEEVR